LLMCFKRFFLFEFFFSCEIKVLRALFWAQEACPHSMHIQERIQIKMSHRLISMGQQMGHTRLLTTKMDDVEPIHIIIRS